jgi:hypothetical protein
MQSSGSTWLYNIVREILAISGLDHVAYRAEIYDNFHDTRAAEGENAVLRGHNIESLLLRVLKLADVKAVLSFRDPRDAIASFLQRFGDYGAKFPRICNDATRSLAALLSASQHLDHCSFFYEDGFTGDPESVRRLAAFLGYSLREDQVYHIFDKYRAETVRAFTAAISELPADRLFVDDTNNAMDRETSFHRTHMSDMRVGKWRDFFDAEAQSALTATFGDYVRLLEAHETGQGRRAQYNPDVKALAAVGVTFTSNLFAPVDNMDNFTRYLTSSEASSDLGVRVLDYIYLPEGRWDFVLTTDATSSFTMRFCQNGQVLREKVAVDGAINFRFDNTLHDHPFDLYMSYEFMADDIAVGAPPPRVTLQASFMHAVPAARAA